MTLKEVVTPQQPLFMIFNSNVWSISLFSIVVLSMLIKLLIHSNRPEIYNLILHLY